MRPRLSTVLVVAFLMLLTALGTATAASVINGKNIKKGSIPLKALNPQAVKALKGRTGATGPAGPAGRVGAQGVAGMPGQPGAPGLSGYEVVTKESAQTDADGWTSVVLTCPAGKKALGYGTSWRNTANNAMAMYVSHATVSINNIGTGYVAYGLGSPNSAWLTLQVTCATVA